MPQLWHLKPAVKSTNRGAESSGPSRHTACCRSWPTPASSHQTVSRLMEVRLAPPLPFLSRVPIYRSCWAARMKSFSRSLGGQEEPTESRQRRRWVLDPPEELLRLLETAQVNRASSTFIIKRGGLFIAERQLSWSVWEPQACGHEEMNGCFLC